MNKALARRVEDLERKTGEDDVRVVVVWSRDGDDIPEPGTIILTWDENDAIEVKRQ